ncbi:MAG: prepilin-type N-terminal cleavage/methylation domain-containing protein [Chthoniobacterales bacterium]|nr:prepilin-type N-terminal cleavage/methylation domain-containing protein [Chthoniobacterales bacterium]
MNLFFKSVSNCRKSHYGFTLLEMVIVLALLTLLATLFFPSWKGLFRSTTTANTTALLLGSFEEARLSALQKHAQTWIVFQHRSQGDRCCSLQRGKDGVLHPLGPWFSLPSNMALELAAESIMTVTPPSEIIQTLSEDASQEECKWGAFCYNAQGAITFPSAASHPLHLDLVTTSLQPAIHDQIFFSPLTGRAFRKSDF